MLDIIIKGGEGEGKSRTAKAILDFWELEYKNVKIVEDYKKGKKINTKDVEVLIKVVAPWTVYDLP